MESNSLNPRTEPADAQENTGGSSNSAWSAAREPGQSDQTGQRRDTEDADTVGRTADAAQGYLQDAKAKVGAVAQTSKAYAQDAVNAAGKKIDDMRGQAADLKQRGMQFAADEPMKAVAYAAACSAVLTAVLLSLMRGRR